MKKEATKQRVKLYTYFEFAYYQNAQNVAMSMASSGYFINIVKDGNTYRVDVYKRA